MLFMMLMIYLMSFIHWLSYKQLKPLSKRGKFFEKVRCFFSSKNQVGQAYRISREVKNIMKRLDDVAHIHNRYRFHVDYKPISRRTDLGTCSYVDPHKIVGRENDKEAIIDLLLNPNVNEDFCSLTIVGVGGMGKTVVAQLLYDDENVIKEFPTRIWVCVSDHIEESFDENEVLCKILESTTRQKIDRTSMELIQYQFQQELRGKKYLLVLDDVWNEDREKWLKLESFLMLGHRSSKIVVTTRSKRTAEIIGSKHTFELKGLSKEHSWQLFELMAFKQRSETDEYSHEFVEIGKNIVEKCYGSPLAIRVVGSLLYGQEISKWQLFENIGLAEIRKGDNDIMSVLELSYHNLEPSMKACFSYCAVFPKDFKIEKEMLISLWIAHGFVVPLDEGQSIEDAAMEHFMILLHRCFFEKKVTTYKDSDVNPIKIHDLLHDVAQNVTKGEIHVTHSISDNLEDKVRHIRYIGDKCPQISAIGSSKLRSFFCSSKETSFAVDTYVEKWIFLRVLDLSSLGIRSLSGSIGKLLHLRYLNMSYNEDLVGLPDEIKKLHNLQTLLLRCCKSLSALPKDFCQLVKLRHLDLSGCDKLICMPSGMDKLTSLKVLPNFVVGGENSTAHSDHDELKALKCLTEIRGELSIKIGEHYRRPEAMIEKSGGYLKSMKHLTRVGISFENKPGRCVDHDEAAMEALEPPSNLKRLTIYNYKGTTIPRWGRAVDNWAISLFRLVDISLQGCSNLQEMPILSKLPNLKALALHSMDKLEYMETNNNTDTSNADTTTFFPSLLTLGLYGMQKLKGWWKEDQPGVDDHRQSFGFPFLRQLTIGRCPNLTTFPACPSLEELELYDNKMLWSSFPQNLRILKFKYLSNMTSLPEGIQYLSSLQSLELFRCDRIKALPEWISCLSSLQSLSIYRCLALKTLPEAMRNLTTLQRLYIGRCRDLEERCKKPNGEDYPKVQHIPSISLSIDGRY
ncbi:putative disease resistance protein RGA3 [Beta vulgaris subsp. vulgaris]|uniref:putative disease resistance protein RGA3 n=1 Tax=Beta vulgaris subsp. vulgaris TaxID=3555 RepID=UPI002037056B|nr:putative disease resistance protein RGA3 [Beta vulgaris subsp. vulgaris]